MTDEAARLAAYPDHERKTAERMRWWGVYLIREKRRLQDIASAIRTEQADARLEERPDERAQQPE